MHDPPPQKKKKNSLFGCLGNDSDQQGNGLGASYQQYLMSQA